MATGKKSHWTLLKSSDSLIIFADAFCSHKTFRNQFCSWWVSIQASLYALIIKKEQSFVQFPKCTSNCLSVFTWTFDIKNLIQTLLVKAQSQCVTQWFSDIFPGHCHCKSASVGIVVLSLCFFISRKWVVTSCAKSCNPDIGDSTESRYVHYR